MAIKSIEKISCSLNLGFIYDFSYDYQPESGVSISISFVNESGIYDTSKIPNLTTKTQIKIGSAIFNLYPLRYSLVKSADSKILRVDFIDETFRLNHYYITLTDRGCGTNVFQLGAPVDKRTEFQKQQEGNDSDIETLKEFTQFLDLEYTFDDFLAILKRAFNVSVKSSTYDKDLTQAFTGTFRDVLDGWCSFYNLSYYFENGVLNIVDPTTLQIPLPQAPVDALDYIEEKSLENTYNKTAALYYNQEGGEVFLSKSNILGDLLIQNVALYPAGYEFNLEQQEVDLNQVVAAQYGQEFWFVYNYYQGTAETECGWKPTYLSNIASNSQIYQAIQNLLTQLSGLTLGKSGGIAYIDTDVFNQKYEFYRAYGEKIAGRYYFSLNRSSPFDDQNRTTWYDDTRVQTTTFATSTPTLPVDFLTSSTSDVKIIPGTEINSAFKGLNYTGNRILYFDNFEIDFEQEFALSDEITQLIRVYFTNLIEGVFGSSHLDYSEINSNVRYVVFQTQQIRGDIINFSNIIQNKVDLFKHRYSAFNIKGIESNLIAEEDGPNIEILQKSGIEVITDIGTIQALKDSDLVLYYAKYSRCESEDSNLSNAYNRNFLFKEISTDVPVIFRAKYNTAKNYELFRDLTYVNEYFDSEILNNISKGWNEPQKTVSFTLNYLYPNIPTSFITNGLTSLSIQIGADGLKASYSYSNAILQVPELEATIQKIEEGIRNSTIRKYRPKDIISS